MPKSLYFLPLITALALGTASFAQETTETQDATTDSATEAAAQPEESGGAETSDTGLDMGKPVEDDPTYVKETFGDWELKCFRSEAAEDPCQMFQLLREEAGNPVAEFSIFRLPGEAQAIAGATIVVPLGTLLTEEVKLSVDGGKAKSYPFRFCSLVGCYAQIGLTQADIDTFKRGAAASLQIVPAQAPDQKVNIKASLSGFTAAFDATSVLQQ